MNLDLEPEKFRLSLERPLVLEDLKPEAEVVCVITASDTFTPQVGFLAWNLIIKL